MAGGNTIQFLTFAQKDELLNDDDPSKMHINILPQAFMAIHDRQAGN